jgi:hypothetical protein
MQENTEETDLLMLIGIQSGGGMAWIFVPGKWDIRAVERQYDFSGQAGDASRKVFVSIKEARSLVARYGAAPLMAKPGEPTLEELLAEDLSMVRMLILRNQQAAFSAMPL